MSLPTAFDVVQQGQDAARLAGCLDELEDKSRAMIRALSSMARPIPNWRNAKASRWVR